MPSQLSTILGGDPLILSEIVRPRFVPRIYFSPKNILFTEDFVLRIGDLDKKKYLVPSDLTVGQFYFLIRFSSILFEKN